MSVFLLALALLAAHFAGGSESNLDARLAPIVRGHVFSLAGWEIRTITSDVVPSLWKRGATGDVTTVVEYFANVDQARALQSRLDEDSSGAPSDQAGTMAELARLRDRRQSLASEVQRVIERQIADAARGQGIYSPFNVRISFPPVDFKLARPPNLLVVSPRDRIESISETMLDPDISAGDAASIEARVDRLNVSSLVTGIGGLGATYPTFVADDMDLRDTINTCAHEWLHQYLAFRPLGFRYVLDLTGIHQSRDITSLNETLADIAGREIGDLVYEKYYGALSSAGSPPDVAPGAPPAFDFNAEMRAIRRQVDGYLAQGQVEAAEQYMRDERDHLATQGYHIRKLNQAYFAFYGSYTDSPTSVDPIGAEMRQLRSQSSSLKSFLDRASEITSRNGLEAAVVGGGGKSQ
jgi:hypothetical protein